MTGTLEKIGNFILSLLAGMSAFAFTLLGFLVLSRIDQQIAASILIGLFALLVVWVASEKPNSAHSRAVNALIDRLLAVKAGDLASPAPAAVHREIPALASAVEGLFAQVRSNLDNVHALAMYDPVTSLPNRTHFKREAERMLGARRPGHSTALLFIDLDGFKEVNDSRGHHYGDRVLEMVAGRLREVVRSEGGSGADRHPLLARLAGDEFTMLFPALPGAAEAERIAHAALAALCAPYEVAGEFSRIGASIGIALGPDHGADLTSLMKSADIAMYHAKASGRSRACLFGPELAADRKRKARAEQALGVALADGRLALAYRPRIRLVTGAASGAEAVLCCPGEAAAPPGDLLAVAERGSLVFDLGDWMLAEAAAATGRWRAAQLPHRLALRVSARQIERPDFFDRLRSALSAAGPPPWPVELGFTEECAMGWSDSAVAELRALRALGVTVALADVGAGSSALARLLDLPLDSLTLHPGLVRDLGRSERTATLVGALVHLGHGLGCELVAQGVDRPEQIELLRAAGCDEVQGYGCEEPLDEAGFLRWAATRPASPPLAAVS